MIPFSPPTHLLLDLSGQILARQASPAAACDPFFPAPEGMTAHCTSEANSTSHEEDAGREMQPAPRAASRRSRRHRRLRLRPDKLPPPGRCPPRHHRPTRFQGRRPHPDPLPAVAAPSAARRTSAWTPSSARC
ncbi:hypothetical protein BS78_02G085500 [Paspalum vaginatum]|nr:hypothetical protein BS78_02G085500 [Paspalum vaginatum]